MTTTLDPVRVDRLSKRLCTAISSDFVYGYGDDSDECHDRNRLTMLAALAHTVSVFVTGKRDRRDFCQALRAEITRQEINLRACGPPAAAAPRAARFPRAGRAPG